MPHIDFVLPLSRDDLLYATTHSQQYTVRQVYTVRDLVGKFQECEASLARDGSEFIISDFDMFYNALQHFNQLKPEHRQMSLEVLSKGLNQLTSELADVLDTESGIGLDCSIRLKYLNVLKMLAYIFCQHLEAFESESNKPQTDTVISTGKTRKKKKIQDEDCWDWAAVKNSSVQMLYHLLQLPISRLWDPPVVEEEFVNLIANCCYKLLENHSMSYSSAKNTRMSIFQVIGTLIRYFNHGLSCSLKVFQLLKHFEHLVSPLAEGMVYLVEDFGCKNVVSELIREIACMDGKELARDASATRSYSQFLLEVAEKIPAAVRPFISLLLVHLDGESYSMRNCVLGIMGEIVLKVLSTENLDEKSKEIRNQFLECLEDHIHDVHAFVRSKVLQIWLKLCTEKAIPLSKQHQVLELVIGRLQDKSCNVRKNAVQLVTAFLQGNPFAAKLPMEELYAQYESEVERLKKMLPVERKETEDVVPGYKDSWDAIEPEVLLAVKEVLASNVETQEDCRMSVDDIVPKIGNHLYERQHRKAACLLMAVMAENPEADILNLDTEDPLNSQESNMEGNCLQKEDGNQLNENEEKIICLLRRIYVEYLGRVHGPEVVSGEIEKEIKKGVEGAEEKEGEKESEEILKQRMLVQYLKDSLEFAQLIHKALPVICQLLGSKQTTDVLEAVDFFVTAFEFGLLNAMMGVRQMLALIWSKDPVIKTAIVEAYKRLYIQMDGNNARSQAVQVVKNLTALITGATLGELTSMEELLCEFVKSGEIGKICFQVMWERFTMALPGTTEEESQAALVLLGMAAQAEGQIIISNISVLVSMGLGERGRWDFRLVRDTCNALLKLVPAIPKSESLNPPLRFPKDHEMFTRLSVILLEGVSNSEDRQYIPMAAVAITTIYELAEYPDVICGNLLKQVYQLILDYSADIETSDTADNLSSKLQCPISLLSRFIFLAGHIAIRQLVYLDVSVFCELKRRNYLREEKENKEKENAKKKKRRSAVISASVTPRNPKEGADLDDELGAVGAIADDSEAEYIRAVCEMEIVTGENLLALVSPLIVIICSNPNKYTDSELRASATSALAKFMLVSSEFCEQHLQLLFTILEKSAEPVIRANTIIALGDLCFRFPNLIEPWTPHLYGRLRDDSAHVRKNTLTVLTHLILNDMVKVKGQISDMSLCIVDPVEKIAGLAKLFFGELSKKGNALYNVMPDIISRLSDPDVGVDEESFCNIMRYIISLIQKDRHLESLVEKLCYRFRATRTERQWRDIAFCLSLFSYTDRSLCKLLENIACYNDKLHEPKVYEAFVTILNGAKKLPKQEMKNVIEELEEKIEEYHVKGVDDETTAQKAVAATNKHKKGMGVETGRTEQCSAKTPRKTRRKGKRYLLPDSGANTDEENTLHPAHRDNKLPNGIVTRSRRFTRKMCRLQLEEDGDASDDEVSEQEEEVALEVTRRHTRRDLAKTSSDVKVRAKLAQKQHGVPSSSAPLSAKRTRGRQAS